MLSAEYEVLRSAVASGLPKCYIKLGKALPGLDCTCRSHPSPVLYLSVLVSAPPPTIGLNLEREPSEASKSDCGGRVERKHRGREKRRKPRFCCCSRTMLRGPVFVFGFKLSEQAGRLNENPVHANPISLTGLAASVQLSRSLSSCNEYLLPTTHQ